MTTLRKIGMAYGFLKTESSASRIKKAFGNMKAEPEVMVPRDLDLCVAFLRLKSASGSFGGKENRPQIDVAIEADVIPHFTEMLTNIGEDPQLLEITAKMAEGCVNCIIPAILPDATNKKAADELGHVFNLMYSCTEIMGNAEIPVVDIYFKNEEGIYVSKLDVDPRQ